MATWGVADAKARFSAVLDEAEAEGPQRVTRRKREFYIVTREQFDARNPALLHDPAKPFVSAWDALRPSSGESFDVEFPRLRGKLRIPKF